MSHPTSLDLEAFACGEEIERVTTHLEACNACRGHVEKLRGLAAPTLEDARRSVERALRISHARARTKTLLAGASVAVPLAAAAAVVLVLTRGPEPDAAVPKPEPVAAGGLDPDPETAFKGGVQVAVIRDREGEQRRFTSRVGVKAGDRLRVEVALDRSETILAAVIGDDGSYLEIMREGTRGRGTHFSERSARIDAKETRGTIVVGPPSAVDRARSTRRFDGVATVRVEWEGGP